MKVLSLVALLLTGLAVADPELSSQPEEVGKLQTFLGMDAGYRKLDGRVKVAVLAAGFAGMEADGAERLFPRRYLPETTKLISDYGTGGLELRPNDASGRRLAQLAWSLVDYSDKVDFRLYNGNGLSNQRQAVEAMMGWEPDVVLSSEVFPTFGNFDGTGPLNRYIRALAQMGTIWIQSAGTVGGRVVNSKVDFREGYQREHVLNVETDDTEVDITLSWNAFSPGRRFYGTNADLDLVVQDVRGKTVARSELRQTQEEPGEGQTNLATEKVEVTLFKNESPYKVCVLRKNGDFEPSHCYRITLESEKQPFFDKDAKKEIDPLRWSDTGFKGELGVPADNPFVITVGSDHPWSASGPTWDGRSKPDLVFDGAEANFTDKGALVGPQTGVAFLGAMVLSLKSNIPDLQEKHVRRFLDWGRKTPATQKTEKASGRWSMPSLQKMKDLVREHP